MEKQQQDIEEAPVYVTEMVGLLSVYLIYTTGHAPTAVEINQEEGRMILSFNVAEMSGLAFRDARVNLDAAKLSTRNLGPALLEIAKRAARGLEDASKGSVQCRAIFSCRFPLTRHARSGRIIREGEPLVRKDLRSDVRGFDDGGWPVGFRGLALHHLER